MKVIWILVICLALAVVWEIGRSRASSRAILVEGGLYAIPRKNQDGYNIAKILKVDPVGVHVRVYSNRFTAVPKDLHEKTLYLAGIDEAKGKKEEEDLGMGHLPLVKAAFLAWRPVFIKKTSVSAEELEGYKMWQEANGGYFK